MHRPGIEPGPPAWQASILPLNQRCLDIYVELKTQTTFSGSCGRVVKATDSKSVSLWERRFESYQLRNGLFCLLCFPSFGQSKLCSTTQHRFLDSLVVRISACHVEGPGSIPGRGETFGHQSVKELKQWLQNMLLQVRLELTTPA